MADKIDRNLIGERIRKERRRQGLTQQRLAEMTGFSTNYIGCIECGNKNGSFDAYVKIIGALHITFDDLLIDFLPEQVHKNDEKLLEYFHLLDSDEKEFVFKIISSLRQMNKEKDYTEVQS